MINFQSPALLAAGLRALTLALRFALMFFLARSVSLEVLGVFGLYWAALQLATTLLPLDVYAHTSRLILDESGDNRKIVSLHMGLVILSLGLLGPFATLLFGLSTSSVGLLVLGFFMLHLVFETISSEVGRLLVPLGRPLASNVILFVRSALWVIPLVLCLETSLVPGELNFILFFWLFGSICSAVIAMFSLVRVVDGTVAPSFKLGWCYHAVKMSGYFLIATITFRGVLGADRFLVEYQFGIEAVGIYALFASISLGVLGLIESGVSAWLFPGLIAAIRQGEYSTVRPLLKNFVIKNSIATLLLMTVIAILFPLAIYLFLDQLYLEFINVFYIIVFGVFIYCLSMPFHYLIYGFGSDWLLLVIYMLALGCMLAWAFLFMADYGLVGAALMLSIALLVIGVLRVIGAWVLIRRFCP